MAVMEISDAACDACGGFYPQIQPAAQIVLVRRHVFDHLQAWPALDLRRYGATFLIVTDIDEDI